MSVCICVYDHYICFLSCAIFKMTKLDILGTQSPKHIHPKGSQTSSLFCTGLPNDSITSLQVNTTQKCKQMKVSNGGCSVQ